MPTLREKYQQMQVAKNAKPAPELTARDVLKAALPNEKDTRDGAMRIAHLLQKARPHKAILVFNIFGGKRWFVRSLNEGEARKFLEKAKQTKPKPRKE